MNGGHARPALLGAIGTTPVVRLERFAGPEGAEVWLKLESTNRPVPTTTGWRSR